MDMQEILLQIEQDIRAYQGLGHVADYIPELAKVNPNHFAMSVMDIKGNLYSTGDSTTRFSIQSVSKLIVLSMAMEIMRDKLWLKVGREPSGTSFNSLVQLETEMGKPRNPFLNSGALVTTDTMMQNCDNPYEQILSFVRGIVQDESIEYDYEVAMSEFKHSNRNMALAYFMKSFGNIDSDVNELVNVYCHHCALAMSTNELARLFLYLANAGRDPISSEQILSPLQARRVNSLMLTCGLYDNVGEFAYKVGLPAKSGVGGGIIAVLPNNLVVAVWSPELNTSGNSLVGSKALELFSTYTDFSVF